MYESGINKHVYNITEFVLYLTFEIFGEINTNIEQCVLVYNICMKVV